MAYVAQLQPEATPVIACTVSRDVQNFDLLIEDMESAVGERWGDLSFREAITFFAQPEAGHLEFIALAVDAEDEPILSEIATVITAAQRRGIRVILVADRLGPSGLHRLLRMGAEDFVPYPLPEGALGEAIDRLRQPAPGAAPKAPASPQARAPAQVPRPPGPQQGLILPVHGLAGGVGATTFAVNLAWELATLSKANPPRVALMDFDLQFGAVATALGLPRRDRIFDLLSDTSALEAESLLGSMQTFQDRVHVFTAPADMLPLDFIGPEDLQRILSLAQANFDYVILDLPTTIVQWTETVLNSAEVYFALLEPDMRSAQNALRLMRALKAEGLEWEKLRFVLNRAPGFSDLSGKARARRLSENLGAALDLLLPDGARQVTRASDQGRPLALSAAKNPLRREIRRIATEIASGAAPPLSATG